MKKIISLFVVLCVVLSATPSLAVEGISIFVNGEKIECDVEPYIKNGRTMVPMRAIFEALGAEVDWKHNEKTATAVRDKVKISIKIGEEALYKNGERIALDVAAEIKQGRTMLPVRAISEAFGCNVKWLDETREVQITEEERLTKSQRLLLESYLHADREDAKKTMRILNESIEIDDYILTVNEVMGDAMQMYISVSITAKNAEARNELWINQFNWIEIKGSKGDDKWFNLDGSYKSEMEGDTRIFVTSQSSSLYGSIPFVRVGWKKFANTEYIKFEMGEVLEEIRLQLKGLGRDESYIVMQPMRIEMMIPTADITKPRLDIDTYFRMRDGRIVTLSQISGGNSSSSAVGDKLYKHVFNTREVLELADFESVIVKGNEYSIDNAPSYTKIEIPKEMKQFVISQSNAMVHNNVHYTLDVDFLIEQLRIEVTDRSDSMIEFVYAGKRYMIESGSIYVYVDGKKKYELYCAPYWHYDGKIWVTYDFMTKVLGMRMEYLSNSEDIVFIP